MSNITKAQEAKVNKCLDKVFIYPDNIGTMSRREFIDLCKVRDYKIVAVKIKDYTAEEKLENKIKYLAKNGPLGNERHPKTIEYHKMKEQLEQGIYKDEYRVYYGEHIFLVITKTEYEYSKEVHQ